jgi:hypothetical protein
MRRDEQDAAEPVDRPAHRVRLPGFLPETEVGLGEAIKRTTSRVGIKPCGSCLGRAASLNRWLVFTGRR